MVESLDEFFSVYAKRPITSNPGGMSVNHSWAVWFCLKQLSPSFVMESGVLRGHSTWLIEQAVPEARILCFDVSFKLLEFKAKRANYFEGDLTQFDWGSTPVPDDSVALLDDHQNTLCRLKDLRYLGFQKFIVEDNYPVGEGDFYSLNHMKEKSGFTSQQASNAFKKRLRKSKLKALEKSDRSLRELGLKQKVLVEPNSVDWSTLQSRMTSFQTLPPIGLDKKNRWGHDHSGYYETPVALDPDRLKDEADRKYNWITYLSLK
jgi:hypothetical protein